jgi:hypothetical protein
VYTLHTKVNIIPKTVYIEGLWSTLNALCGEISVSHGILAETFYKKTKHWQGRASKFYSNHLLWEISNFRAA